MSEIDQLFSCCEYNYNSPYVVAEMACAHDGDLRHALKIAKAASKADALQIQIFHAEDLVLPEKVPAARKLQLTSDEWKEVARETQKGSVDLWATVFDSKAIDLALQLGVKVIKIHSTDISNPFLLRECAETGLPLSLSVGGSYIDEIIRAVQFLERHGSSELMLTHGFQDFPTSPEDARLGFITTLDSLFPYPIGYQDHTDGNSDLAMTLPLSAVGLGARVLEKHITDDRSRKGTDYISALDPNQFSRFVDQARSVSKAISKRRSNTLSSQEENYRQSMKRRIVTKEDIEPDTQITEDAITLVRADEGLKADQLDDVLGRKSRRLLKKHETIKEKDLQ